MKLQMRAIRTVGSKTLAHSVVLGGLSLLVCFVATLFSEDVKARAFLHAIESDNEKEVRRLLQTGIDLRYVDDKGATPLTHAAAISNERILELLLQFGAEVNFSDATGRTAVMVAAENGNLEAVKTLIAAGANVNIETHLIHGEPFTALLAAVWSENPSAEVVRSLIEAGGTRNKAAVLSALSLARHKHRQDIVRLLEAELGTFESLIHRYEWNSLSGILLGAAVAFLGLLIWPVSRTLSRHAGANTPAIRTIFVGQLCLHLLFVVATTSSRLSNQWPLTFAIRTLGLSCYFCAVGSVGIIASVAAWFGSRSAHQKMGPAPE